MPLSGSVDDRSGRPPTVGGLLLRFSAVGLFVLVAVALVTTVVSRRVGTREAVNDARRSTWQTANDVVQPALTDALADGDPAAVAAMDELVRARILRQALVRVKVWAADGTVVYADDARLIGQRFELDDEEAGVLTTGVGDAGISDLSAPENRYEDRDTKLLEVYMRVLTPSGRPLLFEAYYRYAGVIEAGRRVWLDFAPVALGALVLLEVVQVPIVWSIARRLRRGQEQRELLLRHAIAASDNERRRIASDLHDGVVQDLAGVSFALSAADRRRSERLVVAGPGSGPPVGPEDGVLGDAAARLRESIRALRSLLVEIYPPNLVEEGLGPALADLSARLANRGIAVHLDVNLGDLEPPPAAAALLYRGAQEALRNVTAHAEASTVQLGVTRALGSLVLTVEDDGRGFDPAVAAAAPSGGHVGLRVLADLAAEAGGDLQVYSAPGRGTGLRLEVPTA